MLEAAARLKEMLWKAFSAVLQNDKVLAWGDALLATYGRAREGAIAKRSFALSTSSSEETM